MPAPPARKAHRLPWADLLRRVFLVDALECPKCHGRMRIVAAVMEAPAVERILRGRHQIPDSGRDTQGSPTGRMRGRNAAAKVGSGCIRFLSRWNRRRRAV